MYYPFFLSHLRKIILYLGNIYCQVLYVILLGTYLWIKYTVFKLFRYNHIRTNTNDVEFSLIRKEMDSIDADIEKGQRTLTWNSDGERLRLVLMICKVLQSVSALIIITNHGYYIVQLPEM